MGNLLGIFDQKDRRPEFDVFVDFESAAPTADEQEIFERVKAVLDQAPLILQAVSEYAAAKEEIREAISNPSSEEAQRVAWEAVSRRVLILRTFFQFSHELETVVPLLLEALCTEPPRAALERKQALAKQFAETLHFVFAFDEHKMKNPGPQNDFSYYRRTLSRTKMNNASEEEVGIISNEEANRMSLFLAYPTPMLRSLSEITTKFVSENKGIPLEHTTDCLSMMANICRVVIETPEYSQRFHNPATILFIQRVMVGAIILYDHVHLLGAFSKKNPAIDIRGSVRAIRMHGNPQQEDLINALRYTTKHLNDDDTPKALKSIFD
eukprot:m.319815 g.319815  ORF g.319815 m.319815 type:complete len:324 (+) comp55496_c0_seq1:131-1102(+)